MALIPPLLLGLVLLSSPLRAQSSGGNLLVLSKGDRTLSIVDPATGEVAWKAPSGPDPHEVVASDDGTRAYISNYVPHNTLTVVDLVSRKALPAIDLGPLRNPHGLDFAGGKVWFTAEGADAIGRYDPATNRVDWTFRTGHDRTHMVHVSPDGREAWAANARDGTISIVDLAGKRVVQTLDAKVRSANRLKFTPDGKRVLVSMLANPEVAVFDVATRREVKRVRVGSGAAGIQMQPDGARAYVACTPDDYVAILDLRSLEVVGHISAGRQPDGLAWVAGR